MTVKRALLYYYIAIFDYIYLCDCKRHVYDRIRSAMHLCAPSPRPDSPYGRHGWSAFALGALHGVRATGRATRAAKPRAKPTALEQSLRRRRLEREFGRLEHPAV